MKKRFHIRWDYKGERFVAHVRRDGTIQFSPRESTGRVPAATFDTPSAAASSVGRGQRNGWKTWRFERSGEWIPLDALRKS